MGWHLKLQGSSLSSVLFLWEHFLSLVIDNTSKASRTPTVPLIEGRAVYFSTRQRRTDTFMWLFCTMKKWLWFFTVSQWFLLLPMLCNETQAWPKDQQFLIFVNTVIISYDALLSIKLIVGHYRKDPKVTKENFRSISLVTNGLASLSEKTNLSLIVQNIQSS